MSSNYIFDASCFRVMDGYYPEIFSRFWELLNHLVENEVVFSVDQVRQELLNQGIRPHIEDWVLSNKGIFRVPTSQESVFVANIFKIPKFQESLKQKKRLKKGPFADPWVIAAAGVLDACVVTEESKPPNGSRIPNICEYFDIKCMNLQRFMSHHRWRFK